MHRRLRRVDDMKEFSQLTQISQFADPIDPDWYLKTKRTLKPTFEVKKKLTEAWNSLFE